MAKIVKEDVVKFCIDEGLKNYLEVKTLREKGKLTPVDISGYKLSDSQINTVLKAQLAEWHFKQAAIKKEDLKLQEKRLMASGNGK